MDIGDLCEECEECGDHDCKRCNLGNPCIDCDDYDMETGTCTSEGACGDPNKMSNNGSGVPIGYANGSREYKADDIGKSNTLCQHCTHMKHGPKTIGENSYCDASKVIWLFKNEAVVMCSKFQEEEEK